jgi:heme/copper-type cytochrome/quinol oxidase subunit 4
MIALALGLIQLFRYGSSLPLSIILTLAAISFVLSASFFERYEVGSIMWSMLVSLIATLMLTLLSGGIIYGITTQRQCFYLKRSLGEIEY